MSLAQPHRGRAVAQVFGRLSAQQARVGAERATPRRPPTPSTDPKCAKASATEVAQFTRRTSAQRDLDDVSARQHGALAGSTPTSASTTDREWRVVPADAVPYGLQRRPPAVGAGPRGRARQAAQHRRPAEARAAARERPAADVVAGRLDVTNNGNKLMLDASGSSILPALLARQRATTVRELRSGGPGEPTPSSAPAQPNFMTAVARSSASRSDAITRGHLLPRRHCPSGAAQLTGAVVFVERGNASYPHTSGYSTPCNAPRTWTTTASTRRTGPAC